MNWSRAKTILIIMFLCTAVFQSYTLFSSNAKTKHISPEIIASSVEVLAMNEIYIDSGIIPETNQSLAMIDADNAVFDYVEFAKLVLGNGVKNTNDTSYSSELGTVTFQGNSFTARVKIPEYVQTKTDKTAESSASEMLKSLGIDIKDAVCDVKKTADGYTLTYKNMPEDVPVYNSGLTLSVSKDSVSLYGNWFNITKKSGAQDLKSITSVLIDLINEDIQKPAKITAIDLGYTIPESDKFQKSASLIPVWQITFEDGSIITTDARGIQ